MKFKELINTKDNYKLVKLFALGMVLLIIIPSLPFSDTTKKGLQSLAVVAMGGFAIVTEDGQLYYGCNKPISETDCIMYANEFYSKVYENIKLNECKNKEWGIECTFTGDLK